MSSKLNLKLNKDNFVNLISKLQDLTNIEDVIKLKIDKDNILLYSLLANDVSVLALKSYTLNTDEYIDGAFPRGVITARTENFLVQNTRFYNFNWNDAAAFGTCSHCFHPAATDSGARTVTVRNNTFDSSVTLLINY